MPLIQEEKFKRKDEEKTGDIIQVWVNKEEREIIEKTKAILEQKKDGTALKQMALAGAKLIGSPQIAYILGVVYSNKRKNKRSGIVEFD